MSVRGRHEAASLAERQRDAALRFLSHDARRPAAQILGLIELARLKAPPAEVQVETLLRQIEDEARAGLEASDRLVRWMRAEARPLRLEALDLAALLRQAVDAAWRQAAARRILLQPVCALDDAPCLADRDLLDGALAELLGQSIQLAPPDTLLRFELAVDGAAHWRISLDGDGGRPRSLPSSAPDRALQPRPAELPLLRNAWQRLGGTIDVLRLDADGCIARLRLPRHRVDGTAPAPAAIKE